MALDPLSVAKNILKEFANNEAVAKEVPLAVALAKKFVALEVPYAPAPTHSVALRNFTLPEPSAQTLKQQLIAAIKSDDWNEAASICLALDRQITKRSTNPDKKSAFIGEQ